MAASTQHIKHTPSSGSPSGLQTSPSHRTPKTDNQGSQTRKSSGLALLEVLGQFGPIIGSRLYPSAQAPRYTEGMGVCAGTLFLSAVVALGLRQVFRRENRKLDEKYASRDDNSSDENASEEAAGPKFRFAL